MLASMRMAVKGTVFISLVFLTMQISFAQEMSDASATAPESAAVEVTETEGDLEALSIAAAAAETAAESEGESVDAASTEHVPPPATENALQETVNTQNAVPGTVLESTANPELSATEETTTVPVVPETETENATTTESTDSGIVLGESTTTEESATEEEAEETTEEIVIPGPASLEVVDEDIVADDILNPDLVEVISIEELKPVVEVAEILVKEEKPEFVFELTGTQIPTKKRLFTSEGEVITEETMEETVGTDIDSEKGTLTVSGLCEDAYYVVLLFKEADDYETDPRSHILNKAYPCTSGSFEYSFDRLPQSLPAGTYYILIGEQGDYGGWTPRTSLTEVTINRN